MKLNLPILNSITDRAFYFALKMIDIANHERGNIDKGEPKVGGHATASASSLHILSAIHLVCREPADYIACKPHVSPVDHAFNFLLKNFRDSEGTHFNDELRKLSMRHLRHYSREGEPVFQSYHAESDPDSYRYFPSGSVGIPPVNALYTALGYQYAKDHGYELNDDPYFWCLMGDSEFREGSLHEAMPDAGERELNRLIWIVDYNRQNLDGTRISNEKALRGTDADRMVRLAEANGWQAMKLKHGKKREALFKKPGGQEFKKVLDEDFTDFEFQALITANKADLTYKVLESKSATLKTWLKKFSKEEIHEAFFNLAGHDLESLVEAFEIAKQSKSRPTFIVAYTIKGLGLQCQAQSGNHSTLPEPEELEQMAKKLSLTTQDPFQDFSNSSEEEAYLKKRRTYLVGGIDKMIETVKLRKKKWEEKMKAISLPEEFNITALKLSPQAHTQWMWGQIAAKLDRLAREKQENLTPQEKAWSEVANYFITMAPDVGTSTNTSPNMSGKLYGEVEQEDYESKYGVKDKKSPDVMPNTEKRTGHLRFEIAEGNCMSAAGSIGKFYHFTGIPFYPAMTIYDFFIKRALDQYYYNVYWHSHFATIGTPSGVTLAPEGAQHSWKSDIQMPNSITWEPCFAKELEWILADSLGRHFKGESFNREGALIRCTTKGIVQKEFLERLKQQPRFSSKSEPEIYSEIRKDVLEGGYCLIDYRHEEDAIAGDNLLHIFAMGALVPEAIKASDILKTKGILANVFVVTSPDLLLGNFAYDNNYRHLKEGLGINGNLYLSNGKIENESQWHAVQGARVPILSTHDGEPGLLDNIGSIVGTYHKTLAIRKTSKSGTTKDVFYYHHIDAEGLVNAANDVLEEMTTEKLVLPERILEKSF